MRRVFALLAALMVVGACHRSPEELPRPDAGTSVASATVARPPASPLDAGSSPTRDFCNDVFAADQDRMRQKCALADLGMSQSMARAAGNLCGGDVDLALARKRASFDADAARRCVEMLREKPLAPTSETDTLFAHFPCDRVLVGLQGEGQACRFSVECKDGLACVGYRIGADGVCKKPPAVHEACTLQPYGSILNEAAAAPHHPACVASAYCDGTICQARVPAGKACTRSDSCAGGLSCVGGRCAARAPAGSPCTATSDCVFGLYCESGPDHGAGLCAAKRDDGQECTKQDACKGRCDIPKKPDGHPADKGTCVAVCGSG